MKWPQRPPRYFGKFDSRREADEWIEEHRWMAIQPQDQADTAMPVSGTQRTSNVLSGCLL
jgi:hypothetical protein